MDIKLYILCVPTVFLFNGIGCAMEERSDFHFRPFLYYTLCSLSGVCVYFFYDLNTGSDEATNQ